jgi:hypothetical protein
MVAAAMIVGGGTASAQSTGPSGPGSPVVRSDPGLTDPGSSSSSQAEAAEQKLAVYKQLLTDWAGLTRYGSENSELGAPRPGENRVVFFGDDATELWSGEGFFPGKPYLNRGIRGQNSGQMLVRFRQDVI